MWYAVYVISSGALVNITQTPSASGYLASLGLAAVQIGSAPPASNSVWNATSKTFVNNVANATLSRLAFLSLFTQPIRTAIRTSSDVIVQDFLFLLEMSTDIQLNNPVLAQGVDYLVSIGLLTQAQANSVLAGQPL